MTVGVLTGAIEGLAKQLGGSEPRTGDKLDARSWVRKAVLRAVTQAGCRLAKSAEEGAADGAAGHDGDRY
jgi:hypothetical protein